MAKPLTSDQLDKARALVAEVAAGHPQFAGRLDRELLPWQREIKAMWGLNLTSAGFGYVVGLLATVDAERARADRNAELIGKHDPTGEDHLEEAIAAVARAEKAEADLREVRDSIPDAILRERWPDRAEVFDDDLPTPAMVRMDLRVIGLQSEAMEQRARADQAEADWRACYEDWKRAEAERNAAHAVIRRLRDGWNESPVGQHWTKYDFTRGDQGTPDEPMTDAEAAAIRAATEDHL